MFRDLRPLTLGLPALAAAVLLVACTPTGQGPEASTGSSLPTTGASSSEATAPASGAASPSTSSTSTTATAAAACTTKNLSIDIVQAPGGGAAGSNYLLVRFKNTGSKACSLYGWPGVSLVGDGNGTQLGAAAKRVQADQRRTVTVQPGKRTTAVLQVANAGNYSKKDCGPATADGFRIYAPNQKAAVYVARETPACRKSGAPLLNISPVGTSG